MDDRVQAGLLTGACGIAPALLLVGLGGRRFVAPALALAATAAFVVFKSWPDLPHVLWTGNNDGTMWLLWVVTATALVALLADLRWLPNGALPLLGYLLGCALPFFTALRLHGLFVDVKPRWTPTEGALQVGIGMVVATAGWFFMSRASERRQGVWLPAVWTLCLLADSIALLHSGSALFAQLAGALAAALGTATATSVWRRPFALGPGAVLTLALAHVGVVFAGHHLGELERWPALALALAPAAVWLGGVRELANWPRCGALVAALLALSASGYAVWATWDAGGGGY